MLKRNLCALGAVAAAALYVLMPVQAQAAVATSPAAANAAVTEGQVVDVRLRRHHRHWRHRGHWRHGGWNRGWTTYGWYPYGYYAPYGYYRPGLSLGFSLGGWGHHRHRHWRHRR